MQDLRTHARAHEGFFMSYPLSDDEIEARVMDFLREHGPATTEEISEAVWDTEE